MFVIVVNSDFVNMTLEFVTGLDVIIEVSITDAIIRSRCRGYGGSSCSSCLGSRWKYRGISCNICG